MLLYLYVCVMRISSVVEHRTPRVYVCYCLRSLSRPNQTYIGSTPDPIRRLRQHNGLVKQGAFYTRMARPWTMDVVVYGFPSKLAALQFEWSWQKPHASRHLRVMHDDGTRPNKSSATAAVYAGRSSKPLFPATRSSAPSSAASHDSGLNLRKKNRRVRMRSSTVPEYKFLVLRALLASEPFCFWHLHVGFYSEYAYGVWQFLDRANPTRYSVSRITRRPLPPSYPPVACDFRGVQGTNTPLSPPQDATAHTLRTSSPVLPEATTLSAAQKKKRSTSASCAPENEHVWAEEIPHARDAETLGLTWEQLEHAPTIARMEVPDGLMQASSAARGRSRRLRSHTSFLEALDEDASALEAHLVHASRKDMSSICGLCAGHIDRHVPLSYTHCPHACDAVFHLTCLARYSLEQETRAHARTFCLPTSAWCPMCQRPPVPWPEIVRRVFRRAELKVSM